MDSRSSLQHEVRSQPISGGNRLAIAFFFDEEGIVDEYFFYLLEETRKFTTRNVFVSNGAINDKATARLEAMGFEIVIRENVGFDVWAYKTAIEHVGYDRLGDFDEVLLFNHTFYGPIFPFEEMFEAMDRTPCGFWGITAHKEMDPNPFTQEGILPRHLNSHFIAVRRDLASSRHFKDYWRTMPMITSYIDSVLTHESRFTKHFQDLGFECVVYDDDKKYSSRYPCFIEVDDSLINRCPILKRRIFFHDPTFHEMNAIDLPRALRIMRETSNYDETLIWPNILRTANLRTLNTVAALMTVLPDVRIKQLERTHVKKVAVCAHIYYPDMILELLELTRSISTPFDFIATTDTQHKADAIRQACFQFSKIESVIVRIMPTNRGRDMSSLFITCRDLFIDDRYDLVCRLHSKKSPQVDSARSNIFKRHMFENLLNSPGYVDNVLDMFETQPWTGVAIPPAVHISYFTLGLGWFANKARAEEEARKLDLKIKLDDNTPVAAYGTMFWFRPKALRKLFEHPWQYEDFNPEPHHVDGGLAHVLERLITYTAQDAGYTTHHISSADQNAYSYSMLEFKYAEITSHARFSFAHQLSTLKQWAAAGFPVLNTADGKVLREGFGFKALWSEDESLVGRYDPDASQLLLNPANTRLKAWGPIMASEEGLSWIKKRYESIDKQFSVIYNYLIKFSPIELLGDPQIALQDKIREYLLFGWAIGNDIFSLFSSKFYLDTNEDVAVSDMNPFVHYISHGRQEGRAPHPLFDPKYYAQQLIDKSNPKADLILNFLSNGCESSISPHPMFDMKNYYQIYPDVKDRDENALSHYIRHGARELRQPHILFDRQFYEAGLGGRLSSDINPLIHYLQVGAKAAIDPHPLFDATYYLSTSKTDVRLQDALPHFLSAHSHEIGNPHPLFDVAWYTQQFSGRKFSENALLHYLRAGPFATETSHPLFDRGAYFRAYPDVHAAALDPLIHYVKYGALENRFVPGFDEAEYRRRTGVSRKSAPNAFVHFLKNEYGIAS